MKRTVGILFIMISVITCNASADEMNTAESRKALEKVVNDYIENYRQKTLDQWKELFHPSVTVFFPAEDGTISVRNLEEFFERQKNYFAKRKSISERLENVQIFTGKRIARIAADFVFVDEGVEHPGKLGLHIVEGTSGWKIVAVLFSYSNR